MLVTLFTDASWCPDHKVAGWAAWCKSDFGMRRSAGILKGEIPSPTYAELAALINGIWFVANHAHPVKLPPKTRVIAQTDCLAAIDALRGTSKSPQMFALAAKGIELIGRYKMVMDFRHVKAHTNNTDRTTKEGKRSLVNDWCDNAARIEMKFARAQKLKNNSLQA